MKKLCSQKNQFGIFFLAIIFVFEKSGSFCETARAAFDHNSRSVVATILRKQNNGTRVSGKISQPAKTTENFFESNPLVFSSLAKWGQTAKHRGSVHVSHPAVPGSNLTAGKIETNSFFRGTCRSKICLMSAHSEKSKNISVWRLLDTTIIITIHNLMTASIHLLL